eukprot:scaffold976_cov214-Ochromonas_danica.AAC.12
MTELDKRIADLEEEIKGYVIKLNAATTEKELVLFAGLINSRTETLNLLLHEKKALSGGVISNLGPQVGTETAGGLMDVAVSAVSITPSTASKKTVGLLKRELGVVRERKMTAKDTLDELFGVGNVPEVADDGHFDAIQNWVGNQAEKITAAKNHIEAQLKKFIPDVAENFSFKDVHEWTNLWDFPLNTAKVRGTTDIVVAAADSVDDAEGLAPEILLCFEIKDPPLNWMEHVSQIKVELLAARAVSKRPLVCFLTDLTSDAQVLRVVAISDEKFEIVQSEVTLDQMALISAAILKPKYKTVKFEIDEAATDVRAGPEQDAVKFKRKFDQMYAQDDGGDVLQDLLEDTGLPLRYKCQAVRENLRLSGLHSNLLDAQEGLFRLHQQQLYSREGCGTEWTSMHI